jgi:hypothetical protein
MNELTVQDLPNWISIETRPQDQQMIVYLFEPFGKFHVGKYHADEDCVVRVGGGFTTVIPEVPFWMPAQLDQIIKE